MVTCWRGGQFWIVDNYLMRSPEDYSKVPKSGLASSFEGPDYGSNL